MISPYSTPATGFMTLEPICDLGSDEVVALWKAGARKGNVTKAKGRAILVLRPGRAPVAVRIDALDDQEARRTAIRSLPDGDVVLLEATFRGRSTVFRRVEVLQALTPDQADRAGAPHIVTSTGWLVEKLMSPADPFDQRRIADRLAGQLRHAELLKYGDAFKKYVATLNIDWARLTPNAFTGKLVEIRTDLRAMMGSAANQLMPTWRTKVEATLTNVFRSTRQVIKDNFTPTIGLSLRQPDVRAIGNIASQQGLFMRNAAGRRSDQLTRQAKKIVTAGLKDGLGKVQIAQQLRDQLPKAWQARGLQYFKTVASVGVSRARSYSEVTGYLEVGIESLEVQAVMDERTTETCRCLDGMIIETHVASVQVMGAINEVDPTVGSPFLREMRDPQTGVNQILAGNGVKIADVVRSGMGRVDDRGQFAYNKSLAGLSDQNIGPPPYHHLCRSWTIPVSNTVSVPRGSWPRAGGPTSPIPPRPVPKGGSPMRGVGARPQSVFANPTPGNPTLVGDPAYIDAYPFSEDFISPIPSKLVDPVTGEYAATFQRYQFNAAEMAIRPVGNIGVVARSAEAGEWNALSNLVNDLKLTSETSGVVMHVGEINAAATRNIILADAKQPAASRVYSITSSSGKQQFLRINPDKKYISRNWLHHLRYAKTEARIQQTLGMLTDKGYLVITTDAKAVTFGKPVAPLTPIPTPKPMPKPKAPKPPKVPKPGPHEPGPPQPKPQPSTVEPSMPYHPPPKPPKVPKPPKPPKDEGPFLGEAKDYSQHGLVPNIPVSAQLQERIRIETARVNDHLKAVSNRLRRPLTSTERAKSVRKFVEKDTGYVKPLTTNDLFTFTKAPGKYDHVSLTRSIQVSTRDGTMRRAGRGKPVSAIQMSRAEAVPLYNDAIKHLSPRLMERAMSSAHGLPRIYKARNVNGGAFYSDKLNAIVIPETYKTSGIGSIEQLFRHELGHYLDTVGLGETASIAFRDAYKLGDAIYRAARAKWNYVKGKWGDTYTGRIYSFKASEVTSTMAESFAKGQEYRLSTMYDANPDHVGFYMAHSKGCFVK